MVLLKGIVLNWEVFLLSIKSSLFVGPIQLPIRWVSSTFPSEVKQPELEYDHSHPSRTRRKIDGDVFTLFTACLATTLHLYYPYDTLFWQMSRFIHALQKSILRHQWHVQITGAPVCYVAVGGGFPRSNTESEITHPETLHNFSSIPTLNCRQIEI